MAENRHRCEAKSLMARKACSHTLVHFETWLQAGMKAKVCSPLCIHRSTVSSCDTILYFLNRHTSHHVLFLVGGPPEDVVFRFCNNRFHSSSSSLLESSSYIKARPYAQTDNLEHKLWHRIHWHLLGYCCRRATVQQDCRHLRYCCRAPANVC